MASDYLGGDTMTNLGARALGFKSLPRGWSRGYSRRRIENEGSKGWGFRGKEFEGKEFEGKEFEGKELEGKGPE